MKLFLLKTMSRQMPVACKGIHSQASVGNCFIVAHNYTVTKGYPDIIGASLRCKYENGKIKNEQEFKEVLEHVLSDCKKI